MLGTTWRRSGGANDPLFAKLMQERSLTSVPLLAGLSEDQKKYLAQVRALGASRNGPVNPQRVTVSDVEAMTEQVKQRAREFGADLVGVAKLRPIHIDLGVELMHENIIAIGVHEDYEAVLEGGEAVETEAYKAYYYVALIANQVAASIRDLGYEALAHHNGGGEIQALPALHDAGLGELGRHGSLINPTYGASFRPSFVTTDLPLEADQRLVFGVQDYCPNCRLCMNNCPGDAIPQDFVLTDGVKRWLTNIEKCYPYSRLSTDYCHLCVDVCPYNARAHKNPYRAFMQTRKVEGYRTPRHQ